ncbi:aspartic peptidase domain-containing protein [Apodospora peruviana]|uniref:Aspartic peptidase domain-containing protein n=1 Tax=Apodospora peruviana TaxID=516989 RepID=A0AAE0I613_9PEZI|nr:aspartic peptidase domain-containing protein [Apodospora peruviana]
MVSTLLLLQNILGFTSASAARTRLSFPSLNLKWIAEDSFNGAYFVNVKVGQPPQTLTLVHDTGSSDIFIHSTVDTAYLEACAAQTPNDICFPGYANASSKTYKEIGPGKFLPPILGLPISSGSYITDTFHIPGATIQNQIIGSTWFAPVPFGLLGTGFPKVQGGAFQGTFPRYPSFIDRMVSDGTISSATESIWLNPSRADDDPDTFSDGHAIYGAVDTSLFSGDLVTVPAVEPKNTTVSQDPTNWNLAVGSIAKATTPPSANIIANPSSGISCIVDTGTSFFSLPNSSFVNLVALYPNAVYNDSVVGFPGFWELPCSERDNPANALEFTFINPRDTVTNVKISVPAWHVIWPAHNFVPGGDPDKCVLNAVSWEAYFGADSNVGRLFECVLGVSVMKSGYFVLDTGNKEASIARAEVKSRSSRLVAVPKGGVRKLRL